MEWGGPSSHPSLFCLVCEMESVGPHPPPQHHLIPHKISMSPVNNSFFHRKRGRTAHHYIKKIKWDKNSYNTTSHTPLNSHPLHCTLITLAAMNGTKFNQKQESNLLELRPSRGIYLKPSPDIRTKQMN